MKVQVLGEGNPEVAIVSCIHGDETVGWEAIGKLKQMEDDLLKPVKVILANQKAFDQGERFIEKDLNRSFPGDPKSSVYEDRVGAELLEEVKDLKVLDIHSTESEPTPFGIVESIDDGTREVIEASGLERIVDMSFVSGGFMNYVEGVSAEFDKNNEGSVDNAFEVLKNFLKYFGTLEGDAKESDADLYAVFDKAEGSGYRFKGNNFERVEQGEIFAEKASDSLEAGESFYPVLMSTDGYDSMVGFKAEKQE